MKVERRDGADERKIITGMIVDDRVLARITNYWKDEGLFSSKWCNVIGNLCVKFYKRYGKAPQDSIETLFGRWAERRSDKETIQLVEKLLGVLSGEYEHQATASNSEYIIDLAGNHFNKVAIQKLKDEIEADLEEGHPEKSENRIATFNRLELGIGSGIDVLRDSDAYRDAMEHSSDVLIKYKGALGNFFGTCLERDGFVALMGPEKRGKSWWLMDLAWNAMIQRRKVAFFEVGDMSQRQILRRFGVRASRRPIKPRIVKWPKRIEHYPDAANAEITEYKELKFTKRLTWRQIEEANQNIIKSRLKSSNEVYLKLSVHPNTSLSVDGMHSILRNWESNGWTPDVIVVDYADILAPPAGMVESRDAINSTWKRLRALSQQLHCLVITATQADAQSYDVDTLSRRNFSEDKRKFAHVTAMIGLNANEVDDQNKTMRLNFLALRDDEFVATKCVHVATCLSLANPAVLSTF